MGMEFGNVIFWRGEDSTNWEKHRGLGEAWRENDERDWAVTGANRSVRNSIQFFSHLTPSSGPIFWLPFWAPVSSESPILSQLVSFLSALFELSLEEASTPQVSIGANDVEVIVSGSGRAALASLHPKTCFAVSTDKPSINVFEEVLSGTCHSVASTLLSFSETCWSPCGWLTYRSQGRAMFCIFYQVRPTLGISWALVANHLNHRLWFWALVLKLFHSRNTFQLRTLSCPSKVPLDESKD